MLFIFYYLLLILFFYCIFQFKQLFNTNFIQFFLKPGVAEDGFISRQQSYQQSRGGPSMGSVDFSEGGDFGEGGLKKGHKIDEWQAAWNVTNAIQVS